MDKNRDADVFQNHDIYFVNKAKLADYSAYSVGTNNRSIKITYQSIGYTNTSLYVYRLDENKPSDRIEIESSTWTNSGKM